MDDLPVSPLPASPRQILSEITSVRALLESQAIHESDAEALPLRVGRHHDAIIIDFGDVKGRAIKVSAEGWEVLDRSPITFRRMTSTLPMVKPVAPGQGSPDAMRKLFNVDDDVWDFLVNWQISTFLPEIPHVMPIIEGNPGVAKTTTSKAIVEVVDPSMAMLNPPPRNQQALDIAASGSWVLVLENVTHIPVEISNGLARLITGTATRERELYTNSDIHIREQRRVVVMNGIHITGILPDLLDRSVSIPLRPISNRRRMRESSHRHLFNKAAPAHLGYLLDVMVKAMGYAADGSHKLRSTGRMADFEHWLNYCDLVRETKTLEWYRQQRIGDAVSLALDDVLAQALHSWIPSSEAPPNLNMTAGQWLEMVRPPEGAGRQLWPQSARAFTQRMRTLSGGLRQAGWTVAESKVHNQTMWRIELPPKADKRE